MTTVDVDVRDTGSDWCLQVHNGLFGPATNLLAAVGQLVEQGLADVTYRGTDISARCRGHLLIPIVESLSQASLNGRAVTGAEAAEEMHGESTYAVSGVEF